MPESVVLVIDQGTTSSRAVLFSERAEPLFSHARPVRSHNFDDCCVEQDAEELWRDLLHCLQVCLDHADEADWQVAAMGITNQRETVVAWDRETREACAPAIVWQDSRTAATLAQLKSQNPKLEGRVNRQTGLLLDPYFSASKMRWLLENDANVREKAKDGRLALGTIDSFLLAKLAGDSGQPQRIEATNASRTLLFDLQQGTFSKTLCEMFQVAPEWLGEICPSHGQIAEAHIFGRTIPVTGVAGDQQASLVGHGALHSGHAKCTFGTGAFLLAWLGDDLRFSQNRLLTTVALRDQSGHDFHAMEGSCFYAGAAIEWMIRELGLASSVEELNTLVAGRDAPSDLLFVPAFAGLGAPWWNPSARAAILGLTPASGKADIAVAGLHGIILQVRDLLRAYASDGIEIATLRCDGGVTQSRWFCQQLANILQCEIEVPEYRECTARGAALLALRGAGIRSSLEIENSGEKYLPQWDPEQASDYHDRWMEAVEKL